MLQNPGINSVSYKRTEMQKEIIIQKLKEQGLRITKQRLMLLDIILEEDCSCCKEIYYRASGLDSKIGTATVYRMINTLEQIGAISRKNMYKIECQDENRHKDACTIKFEDNSEIEISIKKYHQILQTGLRACGYTDGKRVCNVEAH